MALSKRLFALYNMIDKGSVVADIGCDHGLLPIALVKDGVCEHAYACDLREGPLKHAQKAIKQHCLEDKVVTLLRNGIDDLPQDVDTIVIAGMGFDTIKMILENNFNTLSMYQSFIVQSNTHVEDLRRWISEQGFCILQEDLIEEDHFYEIIKFSCSKGRSLTEDEIMFGKLCNHPLFTSYWQFRLDKIALVLQRMPKAHEQYKNIEKIYTRIQNKVKEKTVD